MNDAAIMEKEKVKVTSQDIKAAIKMAFGAPSYQTFFEVSNDTGAKITNYADAVSIGVWPSTGHEVHGFEVKISRGDFRKEMADFGKSNSIYKYCHRWSLVCPAGMVKVDELPHTWGLFEYADGQIRCKRSATLLNPQTLSPGFVAAMVRRAGEADEAAVKAAVADARGAWEAQLENEVERRVAARRAAQTSSAQILAAIQKEFADDLHFYDAAKIVRAVKVARDMKLTDSWDGPLNLLAQLETMTNGMRESLALNGVPVPAKKKGKK